MPRAVDVAIAGLALALTAPVQPDATLAVDHVPPRFQADRDRRGGEHGRGHEQRSPRDDDVERPPGHRVPSGADQPAGVPWRSQSHSPIAIEACVRT